MSKLVDESSLMASFVSSPPFMAPEVFQAKFNGTRFSQWKFGALIMARAKKLVGIIEGTEQKPDEVTKLLLVF